MTQGVDVIESASKASPIVHTLEAKGLKKRYGSRQVVKGVDLAVKSGEVVGLLGPNGAGKTTTFYMVVGLVVADDGNIELDGNSIAHLPIYKRARLGLSYLPQEASVFRKLTVEDNIRAILELQKDSEGRPLSEDEIRTRLDRLLDELQIQHIRTNTAISLSGGERRRTEIARALAADPRFILESPEPPLGFNTVVDPAHPQYILAAVNGYVFYSEGRITVKHLLNVRQDVSFQTGNIHFVGDMCVHGSVRAGFSVHANNVRIMGMVEGGSVDARRDLVIDVGARGGTGQHCVLEARGKILSPFLEKVEVRSRSHVITEKYCLYCTAYVGGNLVVRESLYGTTANAYGSVFVGKQLGNKAGVSTRVFLGYDPENIRELEELDATISSLSQTLVHLKAVAGHLPPDATEASRKLVRTEKQRAQLIDQRESLWKKLSRDEASMSACRLIVPGTVYPGVEISIGRTFMLSEDDIIVVPNSREDLQ